MVELRLAPETASRLARYLGTIRPDVARTEHWRRFGAMNNIACAPDAGLVRFNAGAGFDSEYELTFRPPTVREAAGALVRRLQGRDDTARFAAAFEKIWGGKPPISLDAAGSVLGAPLTAHKIVAVHYASLLLPHLPQRKSLAYLEIGPGSGYLAALIHHHHPGPLVVIDLPEILPFSFLTLHRIFPSTPFVLPNEALGDPLPIESRCFVFLTAGQFAAVPDASIDLSVNTASFGEMLPEQIELYFSFLRRVRRRDGLFFTSNRVEKWMTGPEIPPPGIPIRFADYPWMPDDTNLISGVSEFHALVQPENPVRNRLCRLGGEQTTPAR